MDPQNIGVEMDKAIYYAKEGFNGPVWLDIPVDVQNMRVEETELDRWSPDVRTKSQERRGKEIDDVTAMIEKAERPVFLIGNGVRAAHAVEDFEELVRKTRIPVVFSNSAVDIYGTANELGIGTVGVLGNNRCANLRSRIQTWSFPSVVGYPPLPLVLSMRSSLERPRCCS